MPTLVIDGHPDVLSFGASLAHTYVDANPGSTLLALRDLEFDPNLRGGYRVRTELEPDLERAWEQIVQATHVVVFTPVWWGSTPALLKGFFDRVLLPRRAYEYRGNLPVGLLTGRTGRLFVTTDSPWWYLAMANNTTVRQVARLTLAFCGIKPVRVTRFGPVRTSNEATRDKWRSRVAALAAKDAAQHGTPPHEAVPADVIPAAA